MVTRQELLGNWTELKGQLQEKWGELTDDDLEHARGNFNQLVGAIHRRTGEAREQIEAFVESAANGSSSVVERVREAAQEYAAQAGETAGEYYRHAADSVADSCQSVQECVRSRPMQSIAMTFGVGIVAGALLGLVLKDRS